ncbi:MAG: type II toxin-antitoxin system RelE/ParE family toxin [DPANN group archaeon]|nr:type II toxin-antitoxin system RelE/ParE family toxin [DPANN group archaeon]
MEKQQICLNLRQIWVFRVFDVEFSSHAERFLKKSDKQLAIRLLEKIENLSEDPFPADIKRVVNRNEKIFRIRVGDYRIQYSVDYKKNLIFISDINKRSRAY